MKRILRLPVTLLFLCDALIFCLSGPYHEAPWIVKPSIGSVKIDFGGQRMSADARSITASITRRELALLDNFTELRRADFLSSGCYREIAAWAEAHPDVEVLYRVPLPNGESVGSETQELDVSWLGTAEVDHFIDTLHYLPNMRILRLGEIGGSRLTLRDMKKLHEAAPDVEFRFSAVIGGGVVNSEASSIDLRGVVHEDAQAAAIVLYCMQNLADVELGSEGACQLTWEDIAMLKATRPDVRFRYSFTLYGRQVDLDAKELDFRGVKVTDNGDALYPVLSCMNNCALLDMDNTGVSNEALGKLRDLFPQTRIVWRVWFGENYSVRTDVERILASKPTVGGMIYNASVLKYCTDVKYLDLGHNDELSDLSFALYMPKLEVCIIAMTGIRDISPLRNCPALEYLELNSTQIADLSPLAGCTALRHLNIACCPQVRDISPLYGITELERLWIGCQTPVPSDQVKKMKAAAPGCTINTTAEDPTEEYWRYTAYDPEEPKYYWVPRYEKLRNQMGYNYQEYSFYWLDPLCGMEAPEEFRGMFGKEVYGL